MHTFITIDWGTSSFRASRWACSDRIWSIGERLNSADGLLKIVGGQFESTMLSHIEPWLEHPCTILMSGMVGSRTGWVEASYVETPASIESIARHLIAVKPSSSRLTGSSIFIVPGVAQHSPADVMRGEETQLMGLPENATLSLNAENSSLIVLPGTHSKHVWMKKNSIERFKTYMTGELFALLSQHSILASQIREDDLQALNPTAQKASFEQAVVMGAKQPTLSSHLFSLRASRLLGQDFYAQSRSTLSGMLIGHELSQLPAASQMLLVGDAQLCEQYAIAAKILGHLATVQKEQSAEQGALRIALAAGLLQYPKD